MKITEAERQELVDLNHKAQTTPVMTLRSDMKDFATQAWDRVREYMDGLAEKYDYDPKTKSIDAETGEIVEFDVGQLIGAG